MRECPCCKLEWPEDRFNGVHDECFKCRIAGLSVSFGPMGKGFWNNYTNKEYADKTIKMARQNGHDPVPASSAGVSLAGSTLKKLEASAPKSSEKVAN